MIDVEKNIVDYLATASVTWLEGALVAGINLFTGPMRGVRDDDKGYPSYACNVFISGGSAPIGMGIAPKLSHGVVIMLRVSGDTDPYSIGTKLIDKIRNALHHSSVVGCVRGSFESPSHAVYVGIDSQGLHIWMLNCTVIE